MFSQNLETIKEYHEEIMNSFFAFIWRAYILKIIFSMPIFYLCTYFSISNFNTNFVYIISTFSYFIASIITLHFMNGKKLKFNKRKNTQYTLIIEGLNINNNLLSYTTLAFSLLWRALILSTAFGLLMSLFTNDVGMIDNVGGLVGLMLAWYWLIALSEHKEIYLDFKKVD